MWNFFKRCPLLCCTLLIFAALSTYGATKGKGIEKEDYLTYINKPLWERAFDKEIEFETIDEENDSFEPLDKEQEELTVTPIATALGNEIKKSPSPVNVSSLPVSSSAVSNSAVTSNSSTENTQTGVTPFETYKPVKVQSPYYSDPGMVALTTIYNYKKVGKNYFKDAAFIGDSRMQGLYDYTNLKEEADFFCETGFSLYRWTRGDKVTWKNKGTKVDLKAMMKKNTYKKVYITLGMNDLGYGNEKNFSKWMKELINMIQDTQEDVVIYLMSNLHLSKGRNNLKNEFNNINVNARNVEIAKLADGKRIFYFDINPLFTDKNGYLKEKISTDGCHPFGYCYEDISKFLKKHAVVIN